MNRPRTALLAAGLALVLASCTVSASGSNPEGASPIGVDQVERASGGDGPAWPKGDGAAPPAAAEAPSAGSGKAITGKIVAIRTGVTSDSALDDIVKKYL